MIKIFLFHVPPYQDSNDSGQHSIGQIGEANALSDRLPLSFGTLFSSCVCTATTSRLFADFPNLTGATWFEKNALTMQA